MECLKIACIFVKLKGNMKTKISRNYKDLQENETFESFEMSNCNSLVRLKMLER
jgi:hypothetical protein